MSAAYKAPRLARIFRQGGAHGALHRDAWSFDKLRMHGCGARSQGSVPLATSAVRPGARCRDAVGAERFCANQIGFADAVHRLLDTARRIAALVKYPG